MAYRVLDNGEKRGTMDVDEEYKREVVPPKVKYVPFPRTLRA
jgi:hypothetical protein